MSTDYRFNSRQLFPYCDNWENGYHGALWYIWEDDAISIVDGDVKIQMVRGYVAALIANKEAIFTSNFNNLEFYKAYNQELEESSFPNRYPYHEGRRIIYDWLYTLQQLELIQRDFTGYLDRYTLMRVGQIIREFFNPYKTLDLKEKLKSKCYYTFRLNAQNKPQFVFSSIPGNDSTQSAPMIWIKDVDKPYDQSRKQVIGFLASIINYAMYCYWAKHWERMDFANLSVVEKYFTAWKKHEPVIEIESLDELPILGSVKIVDLCQAYMDVFLPIMRRACECNPKIPFTCWEGDNIYSYMYACECDALSEFMKSQLYYSLSLSQQQALYAYESRFHEFLLKNYPITRKTQQSIMRELARDIPPIQLQITNNTTITREGKGLPKKGKYDDVLDWLAQEKEDGKDYYAEAGNNRSNMCRIISPIVGWEVNENSVQKAENRRRKQHF